jgi:hypothetical protein
MDLERRGLRWIPLGLWLVGVPFLLTLPLDSATEALPAWLYQGLPVVLVEWVAALGDKVVHALLFGVGAWLLHRAPLPLGTAALAAFTYGGLWEGVQHFLPARSAEWGDLMANGVGSLVYACGVVGYQRWRGIR